MMSRLRLRHRPGRSAHSSPATTNDQPQDVVGASVSPHERDADAWAEQQRRDALPHARTLAQQWTATVSALTALFGASTLLSSDDVVAKLQHGWAFGYGALALAALISAGLAILYGSFAAQARLGAMPADVTERARVYDGLVGYSMRRIRYSRVLAGVASALLIFSLGIRWYAPRKPAPPTPATTIAEPH